MFNKLEIEQKIAEYLLQIKAIKLQPENPFTWASGWKSPIYCDNRITLSHPPIRTYIRQQLVALIQEEFGPINLIAGVSTAGIPQGVLVAQELGLPFIYVRSKPKEHGRSNLIEGEYFEGQRVVVIEDLISTGGSSLQTVAALRAVKLNVAGLVAIFSYQLKIALENFTNANCKFAALSNYDALIKYASNHNLIQLSDLDLLRKWKISPETWQQ